MTVGTPEQRDDGYLKWRKDAMSPRMRRVTMAVAIAGSTAMTLPHFFVADKRLVDMCFILGLALGCVAVAIEIGSIHVE